MLVFIHAFEEMYQGLHGIEDMRVVEVQSMAEADDWGREMSCGVIESYGLNEEYGYEEDDEEMDYREHMAWCVFRIKDEYVGLGEEELERLACRVHGAEGFIDKYCVLE